MITERTLRRWRQDALRQVDHVELPSDEQCRKRYDESCERILRLTQVLLDQHLLDKRKRS